MTSEISRREFEFLLLGLFSGTLIGNTLHAEVLPEIRKVLNYSPEIYKLKSSMIVDKCGKEEYHEFANATTFMIKRGTRYTYFLTNRHAVTGMPPGVPYMFQDQVKGRIHHIEMGNREKLDKADYEMEVLGFSKDHDTAVLRVEQVVQCPMRIASMKRATPDIGETIYTIGFPRGMGPMVDKGLISSGTDNAVINNCKLGKGWWSSLDAVPGMSGSPSIIVRNDKPYLIGYMCAGMGIAGTYSYVIDIRQGDKLLEELIK